MLIVVVACFAVQQVFKYEGIFAEQLKYEGHDLLAGPAPVVLNRVGIDSIMDDSFEICVQHLDMEDARRLVAERVLWLVIEQDTEDWLLSTTDLARYLENQQGSESLPEKIDLLALSAKAVLLGSIHSPATLDEAVAEIRSCGVEALLVIESTTDTNSRVVGVITRDTLMSFYGM